MATLEVNNARSSNAWIQLNVNETGWAGTCTKAPEGETTDVPIVDASGKTPTSITSLDVRFHKSDNADGSGKGDLDAQYSAGANGAVVILGRSSGSPTYNASLTLEADNAPVTTVFGYIGSTSN